MDRTNICKNIIQSIKDYIMDPVKLEPHRAEKHFVRKRKLTLLHVIIYLLYSSKASMFQNLSRIRDDLSALSFPDVSKQALSKARQFINPSLFKELYYLSVDLFYKQIPSRKLWNGYHLFAVDGSRIELPNSQSTFDFSVRCPVFLTLTGAIPWHWLLLFMMSLMIILSMLLYISSYPLNVQLHWNISKYWKIWGSIRIALLF